MGKCFACDTKTEATATLQTSSRLSGPQYCHSSPCVSLAKGIGPLGIIDDKKSIFRGVGGSWTFDYFQSLVFRGL